MKICKPIKEFEDRYAICDDGTVYNIKRNKALSPYNNHAGKGYLCVDLYIGKKRVRRVGVHQLLAEHFIENEKELKEINHKDGNTLNNSLDNLEWVTHRQNMVHSTRVLKNKVGFMVSKFNESKKIPIIQYDIYGNKIERFNSIYEASKSTNISRTYIKEHLKGKYKSVKNNIFKYDDCV